MKFMLCNIFLPYKAIKHLSSYVITEKLCVPRVDCKLGDLLYSLQKILKNLFGLNYFLGRRLELSSRQAIIKKFEDFKIDSPFKASVYSFILTKIVNASFTYFRHRLTNILYERRTLKSNDPQKKTVLG